MQITLLRENIMGIMVPSCLILSRQEVKSAGRQFQNDQFKKAMFRFHC